MGCLHCFDYCMINIRLNDGSLVGTVGLGAEARLFRWEPSDRLVFSPPAAGTLQVLPAK